MASLWEELKRRNVVRVAIAYFVVGWLVLQITDVLAGLLGLPQWVGKFVILVLLIGLPVTLFLAWAYELTPEGLKKERDVDSGESTAKIAGRKLDFTIIGLLAVAILFLVIDNYVLDRKPTDAVEADGGKSIAVLPLVPLSSGEDDGFFADGLTEEILNSLSQLPELQVTARTSSFFFKGQNIPVPEIASRLNVANVVEGSVRRDGNQLRITAQLIRASDGVHLWSQTYDRTLDDVFDVQEEIAEHVAQALDVVLDDDARRMMRSTGIQDVSAFVAYQKGLKAFADAHQPRRLGLSPTEANAITIAYLEQALKATPGLSAAKLMIADLRSHVVVEIANGSRKEQYTGEAQEQLTALLDELRTASRLSAPGNQRDILDVERTLWSEDWHSLPTLVERALEPADCVKLSWSGELLPPLGWATQLSEKLRDMLACDPLDVTTHYSLAFALIWAGDPEAALRVVDEAENRGLSHATLVGSRFNALLAAGRIDDARATASGGRYWLFVLETLVGDPVKARQMAEEYVADTDSGEGTPEAAAMVGNREKANELAARIDSRPGGTAVLMQQVWACLCGAPFDLEHTPNLKSRIEEAGLPWPPPAPINYPMKAW